MDDSTPRAPAAQALCPSSRQSVKPVLPSSRARRHAIAASIVELAEDMEALAECFDPDVGTSAVVVTALARHACTFAGAWGAKAQTIVDEFGVSEVGVTEVGALQVGALEMRSVQVGMAQV